MAKTDTLSADPSRTLSLRRVAAGRAARPFLELGRRLEEYLTSLPSMPDHDLLDNLERWLEDQGRVVLPQAESTVQEAARAGWERGAARALADSRFVQRGGTALTVNASAASLGVVAAVRSRLSVRENLRGVFGWARRLVKRVWEDTKAGVQQVVGDLLGRRMGLGRIFPVLRDRVRRQSRRAGKAAQDAVIKGHAEGQLDVYESVGVETVVRMVEFTTARDGKVCPTCRNLRGARLTPEKARGVIPIHPNCRCVWVPVEFEEVEVIKKVPYRGLVRKLPRVTPPPPPPVPPAPNPPATTNAVPVDPDPRVLFSRFLSERAQ